MDLHKDFVLDKLQLTSNIKSFNCDHTDLNDFLFNDALKYSDELMGVTYIFETNNEKAEVKAFFTVSNDSLIDKGYGSAWNKLNRKISNQKRRRIYPAAKIGRLGVDISLQGTGIGTQIMDFIKGWFAIGNKTGCRFLLVDAYNNQRTLKYYSKNGFIFLTEDDKKETTRFMYFDLLKILGSNK